MPAKPVPSWPGWTDGCGSAYGACHRALLVLGAVLWRPAMQSIPARGLVLLGDASYSIYLCTNPTRSMVEHFWRVFGYWGGDVGVVLCLVACVALGLLCYLAIERPIMRFFHNWYKQLPFSGHRSEAAGLHDTAT